MKKLVWALLIAAAVLAAVSLVFVLAPRGAADFDDGVRLKPAPAGGSAR